MTEMLISTVLHALGGVALAWLVWAVGAGLLRGRWDAFLPAAYAFGLLAVTAASVLVLITPWLAFIAVPFLAAMAARAPLRAALGRALPALPSAVGLGVALGWLLHPPTRSLASNAFGDFVYFATKALSAHTSLAPLRDYLLEGQRSGYLEGAPTFIAGALENLPGFDPFLFGAATLPAFLVTAIALGFGVMRLRGGVVLALLGVTCVAYPTWLTESAPVALAVPLAFPLYSLARDAVGRSSWIGIGGVICLDFVLTKGFGLITLVAVVVAALIRQHGFEPRTIARWGLPALLVGAAALGVFLATSSWLVHVVEAKFLPADAVRGLHSELHVRNAQAITPTLLIVGEWLLLVVLARARAWTFVSALAAGMLSTWFVGGHGLDVTIGLAILLSVLFFADTPGLVKERLPLLATAAAVLAISAWFRDISGIRTAFFFVSLLGLGLLACLSRGLARPAAAVALLLAVAAPFALERGPTTLYPEDFEVWDQVAHRVPPDGLVFTSETGPVITGDQGWNYYPGIARRQVYLAGWSNSPLLVHRDTLARLLVVNSDVLSGRTSPRAVHLSRRYEGYYAVLRAREPAPPTFRRVYGNDRFVLYRIES